MKKTILAIIIVVAVLFSVNDAAARGQGHKGKHGGDDIHVTVGLGFGGIAIGAGNVRSWGTGYYYDPGPYYPAQREVIIIERPIERVVMQQPVMDTAYGSNGPAEFWENSCLTNETHLPNGALIFDKQRRIIRYIPAGKILPAGKCF